MLTIVVKLLNIYSHCGLHLSNANFVKTTFPGEFHELQCNAHTPAQRQKQKHKQIFAITEEKKESANRDPPCATELLQMKCNFKFAAKESHKRKLRRRRRLRLRLRRRRPLQKVMEWRA